MKEPPDAVEIISGASSLFIPLEQKFLMNLIVLVHATSTLSP